jgi:predicted nucleotidyltransferase
MRAKDQIVVVEIKFGSHLYGTATPESDLDIKGIYLPSARDVLLQHIKPVFSRSRLKYHGEKNTAADIDYELYSPEKFLSMLAEGQMIPLEMLFAPKDLILSDPHPLWADIRSLAPNLFTKHAARSVQYCKQQANKYGIKGSRVSAARNALACLSKAEHQYGATAKLLSIEDLLQNLAEHNEFLAISESVDSKGEQSRYFDICGKKANFNTSIKSAHSMAQGLVDGYGERSLAAERNKGIDWKALSHAVRVGHQSIEFLRTHHITLPRPEAAYLLDIKLGKVPFKEIAAEIEDLLVRVEEASCLSTLPSQLDRSLIDNFIEKTHIDQILKEVQ